jgi:threonine/homoserine/homoserine lactone efflux protein
MEFVIGIICGVLLSLFFSLGPAFFALIQNSIHHGFRKAVSFVAGVSLSDVIVVLLMLTVLSNLDLNALLHNVYVSIIGGLAIAIFGVLTYRSKVKSAGSGEGRLKFSSIEVTHRWQLMLKGFLLNILNPIIWLYWITLVTFFSASFELSVADRYLFFSGLMLAVFGTDVLKCRLAAMLQHWFTARIMNVFNKVTGYILVAFSVYLVVSIFIPWKSDSVQRVMENVNSAVRHESSQAGQAADTCVVFDTVAPATADTVTDTLL